MVVKNSAGFTFAVFEINTAKPVTNDIFSLVKCPVDLSISLYGKN